MTTASANGASASTIWRSVWTIPPCSTEVVSALEEASVPTAGIETDPVLGKSYVAFRDPDNVQWEFYLAT